MTLGRLSLSALICDDNRPRNYPSTHVNNLPSRDGVHPEEWKKRTRDDLLKYKTIQTKAATAVSVEASSDNPLNGFIAKLSTGESIKAQKIILAYGVVDTLPHIPGFKELWGKSIFHCPYCHGFEVRGSKMGLIANHPMVFHALPMIADLASELTLFSNGPAVFTTEQRGILKNKKIQLIETKIQKLDYQGESLNSVVLENGNSIKLPYLFNFLNEPFKLKSDIGENLGCERNDFGFYKVNEKNATSISGVFACGDNMSMAHSVLLAAASGVVAGSSVVWEILNAKLTKV